MNPEARFGSILFDPPLDRGERDDPSMLSDLNLDQVSPRWWPAGTSTT